MPRLNFFRRIRRFLGGLALLSGLGLCWVIWDGWQAFGRAAPKDLLARSPQWSDGRFVNPQPLYNDAWGAVKGALDTSPDVSPSQPIPTVPVAADFFRTPPPTGLRVTWIGHSTLILEQDSRRILIDPVWGPRASPFTWVGPQRWYEAPLALKDLPELDMVAISHDHYDHLDYPTILALKDKKTTFVVPLGVGSHLEYWGVPKTRIVELDWWERTQIADIEVVLTPARHASGRMGIDTDAKLWAGFAFLGPYHRVYYSGDTGLFPALRDIGRLLGPFDLTMIEVGQYGSAWPDWHLGPEQAVVAHQMAKGKVLLPVHWGTFQLAYHAWTEPIERVLAAGEATGATIFVPRPGESFEPENLPTQARWWPNVPWKTGSEDPIVSTRMNEAP